MPRHASSVKTSPKTGVKSAPRKKAATPVSRTSEMLKDIRVRGEELSARIDDLLRRLG